MNIYADAARALGCGVAALQAVAEVESAGSGFLPDGRPKILFEAHIFSRLTGHKYDQTDPAISSAKWNRALYTKDEYGRLNLARLLNTEAANSSASWGKFQIMGFNFARCGYQTLGNFLYAMQTEAGQLQAFVGFVKAAGLVDELKRLDWPGFARGYNGPGYAENKYDAKMAKAYKKFKEVA